MRQKTRALRFKKWNTKTFSFASNDLVEDPSLHERADEAFALSVRALAAGELGQDLLVAHQSFGRIGADAVSHVLAGVGLQQHDAHFENVLEELPHVRIARPSRDRSVGQVAKDVVELFVRRLLRLELLLTQGFYVDMFNLKVG